jgi:hypothetical protein
VYTTPLLASAVAIILSVSVRDLAAQPNSPATDSAAKAQTPIYKLRADFVVPEGPAFTLVAVDPSAIVRPSSVRELSLSLSDFTSDDGSIAIPTQFGVEAAPFLLAQGRDLTRRQYEQKAWLYRTRVSVATKLSETTRRPTALGVGIRASIIDDSDVRLDDVLAQRVIANLKEQQKIYVAAAGAGPNPVNPFNNPAPMSHEIQLSATQQATVDSLDKQLGKIVAERAEEQWNATILELAVGGSALSRDEDSGPVRLHSAAAWLTLGLRAGPHGQFLLGARASTARDSVTDDQRGSAAASSRLYFGTHAYKAFVEAQVGVEKDQTYTPWFLNSGGEVRFTNSLWSEFTAGIEQTAQKERGKFIARFKLHTALPRVGQSP